MFHPNLKT